jgi:hypothetical protein
MLQPTSIEAIRFSTDDLKAAEAELDAANLDEDQIMELVDGEETDDLSAEEFAAQELERHAAAQGAAPPVLLNSDNNLGQL